MQNITGPIVKGNDFFERKKEIDAIWDSLNRNQSIILSGPRRSGKTSLLYHLSAKSNSNLINIHIDVFDCDDTLTFYQRIVSRLTNQKVEKLTEKNYLKSLNRVFQDSPKKVIILVDEFDSFLENIKMDDKFSVDHLSKFIRELRGFRQYYTNIIWLFTISEFNLLTKFNPNFNDLQIIEVQPLSFEDAKKFLRLLFVKTKIEIDDFHLNYILKKVDWYLPFILQLFYYELDDTLTASKTIKVSTLEIDSVVKSFFNMKKDNDTYLSSLLTDAEFIPKNSNFAKRLFFQSTFKYLRLKVTNNVVENNSDVLQYAIKSLSVEDFQGVVATQFSSIPVNSQWIFLIGENSYGKTTILQSIALGLFDLEDEIKELGYFNDSSLIGIEFLNDFDSETKYVGMDISFPHLACYGPSRLQPQNEQTQNDISKKSSTTYSLFNSDGILLNIEYSMVIWYLKKDPKFEAAKSVFKKLIPYLADIQITDEEKVLYIEKEPDENGQVYKPVNFNQLASGFRSIILMVGDMMIRLFKSQPEVKEPSELAGIVIIDELDLHWHPKMQREIPALLSSIFPKVQFIASTHSLVPLLGAPENSVLLKVNRTKEEGITVEKVDIDFAALSADTMLRDIFDLEKYMSDAKIKAWDRFIALKGLIHFEKDEAKKQVYWKESERIADKYQFEL